MIDIKDNTGKTLHSTPINKGSKRKFELMKDDYITLKFTLEHPVVFGLGTYAECEFGRLEAVEEQSGTFGNTSGGYDYELKLEADYMKWRNKLFKYRPEVVGGNEASWSLTAPLATHMGIFLRCLKAWGYKHGGLEYQYFIDDTVTTENLFLTYSNTNLIDALTMMAEAAGCEWWVDGADIHFGRMADGGDPVTLELGANAVSMTLSKSSGDYFTRIFAFGSTNNISPRYRKKLEFTVADGGWYDTVDGERCIAVVPDKKLEYGYFRDGACSSLNASKDFSPTDAIGLEGNKHNGGYVQNGYLFIQNTWGTAPVNIDVSKLVITFNPTSLPCTFHTLRIGFDLDSVMNGTAEEFELDGSMRQISLRYKYENVFTGGNLTLYYRAIYGKYDAPISISASLILSGSIKVETVYKRADVTITMEDGTQCDAVFDPFYKGESELSVKNGDIHHSYFDEGKKFTLSDIVRSRVPIGYFDSDVDGLTVNGVVQRRLMLPEGIPYVDIYEDMHPDEVIEGVAVFDYIYPGKTLTVSSVDDPLWTDVMEEYTDENGETQERPTGIKVPTYTIRTTELAGFSQDYVIGDELTVTFQTGSLAGLTFGVAFLPDKSTDTEAAFQIVANEDYGGRLPDEIMKPSQGDSTHEADTFVMAGYDTEYMFNDLTAEAEQRLYQETLKYKEKLLGNRGTVTASLFSDWSRDKCATDGTLHPLAAGGSVSIDNKALFPAPVTMRVIGYELNLDIPFDTPQYTIGESPSYSRLGALESKIDSVSLNGSSYLAGAASSTGGGTAVKLIKTNDRTAPSDTNAYSAARTDKEIGEGVQEAKDYTDGKVEGLDGRYLSKVQEDRTWFPLHLGGGADFGSYMAGLLGGKIDATGAAELLSLILRPGLESDNFSTGALGAGFCLKKDENGDAYIEVDRMLVRKIATFVQLMIQELKHVGGQIVLTPASMKCSRVVAVKGNVLTDADGEILFDSNGEVLTDNTDGGEVQFYRCYFEATDGEKTINNEFAVGDQARCQTFNVKEELNTNVSNTYYWRLVTGVGDDYIDLSATDCDAGSTAPAAGDEIVQLGHRTDATRQAAVILSAYGEDAPYIKMYRGISGYSLDGKEFFTASRTKVDITADTIRFRTGQSVEDAMAEIAEEAVKGVSETVDGLVDRLAENIDFVNSLSEELETVKDQVDGAIETWFYDPVPTLTNAPASSWTTTELKNQHLGDLYYSGEGKAYRFQMSGSNYVWQVITDTDVTKALANAKKAQDTADGKRRVFVATPTDASEYDPGDLWVNATYGDYTDEMLRCNTKKAEGAAWSISHWEKASKYTDDSAANAAAKAAEEAAKEAKAANDDLAGFKSDSLISPVEKTALRQQMADIKSEYADTTANAARYGVSAAAYVTAYGKALAALEKYTEAEPEFIPVEADYADISAYYAARQSVLDDTAEAAKAKMDVVIKEVDVEYALGTSATTAPTSGWQTESPQWTEGKYIWQRTVTTTASGKVVRSKAVCIQGASGRGVAETDVSYQAGSSGTTPPAGSWSSSVPSVPEGQYLWTRTVISYNDGTTSTSYSVGKMGAAGKPGADGDGIVSVSTTYQIGTSGTTPPSGTWNASVPSPQKGKYLWTRTVTSYKQGDPTTTYGVSYYGTDGTAAKYVRLAGDQTFVYSNNFSGNPTPTSIKLTATLTGTSGYQWSYKRASQSNFTNISGATSQTYTLSHNNSTIWGSEKSVTLRCTSGGVHDEMTVVKVSSGRNGTDGTDGKDAYTVILTNESHSFQGNTNAAIAATAKCGVIAYKGASRVAATIGSITGMPTGMTVSLSGNGTTGAAFTVAVTASLTTGQGTLTVPVTVDGKQFTKNFSFSVAFKGDKGDKGPQGVQGKPGTDGKTYYTWIRYADNASGGGISNDPTGKEYIGFAYNKTDPDESNTPSDYTWSKIKGEKGDRGVPGVKGEDGTQYWTWIKYSDNANGNPMYDEPKDTTKYIGIAPNRTSPDESGQPGDYTWSRFKGKGVSKITEQYYLSASSSTPTGGSWTYARPEWVKGKHIWTRSEVKWDDGTTTYTDPVLAEDINGLGERAEQAINDAANAKSAADNAQADATEAMERLDEWAADGVISPVEKQGIKDEMARIDADKEQIADGYAEYSLGTPTAYNTSYANYRERLAALSASSHDTIKIPSDFASRQSAYYANRASCLNAIAVAAKSYATTLVAGIEMGGTNHANGTYNRAEIKTFLNKMNHVVGTGYKCTGLKKGDTVTISFDYEASGLTFGDGAMTRIQPDTVYGYSQFAVIPNQNGKGHVKSTVTIKNHYNTGDPVTENDVSAIGVRMDYISGSSGAYLRIWNFMVNKGEHESDWSPSPSDLTPKATFEVLNNSVKSMVEDVNYMNGVVSQHSTLISQNADAISLRATKTEVDTKINGISIGGRNLLMKTNQGTTYWHIGSSESGTVSMAAWGDGVEFKVTRKPTGWGVVITYGMTGTLPLLEPDTEYRLSFDVWCDKAVKRSARIMRNNSSGALSSAPSFTTIANQTAHFELTLVTNSMTETVDSQILYFGGFGDAAATYRFKNLKLEKGNKATDWSPAPEDGTAALEAYKTVNNAELKVLSESISSKVSQTEYDADGNAISQRFSSIEQEVDGITSTVSGLNGRVSTIEQTAEDISLKVASIDPVNLFRDGSFERGENSFEDDGQRLFYKEGIAYPYAADKKFGKMSLRVNADGPVGGSIGIAQAVQKIPVEAGAKYTLVTWKKANKNGFSSYVNIRFFDSSDNQTGNVYNDANATTSWARSELIVPAPSGAAYAKLSFQAVGSSATDYCLFDGIMFVKGDWTGLDRYVDNNSLSAESLLDTGIDIENKKVTVTADRFEVRNNSGEVTARVNADGLLQVGSGEFSGLIRQVPFVVEDAANDDRLTLDGENYIELKEENLVTGGFIVINQTSNSYVGQGINLPVGLRYAGTRIFIIKRWASLGNFTIRTVPEDLPDGYTEWRDESALPSKELFRIRNKTAVAIWMGESGSWDNEFLELVAMPKMFDAGANGRKAYGYVEWVVMNAWQWSVKSDGGRNVGYRQNGY